LARVTDILTYIPPVLRDYKEYKAIATAINPELNLLWQAIEDALNDQFIMNSTENGVKRRENILKIIPKGTDTLDERKFRLIARENEKLPYTYRALEQNIIKLCGKDGYSLTVSNNTFTITVRLALTNKSNYNDVDSLIHKLAPENMVIDLSLLYNQNSTLAKFTHAQLSAYTQDQLRNEVLV
jgi:hypothetical protein